MKVRYKQSVIGGAWAIIQPVTLALVFAVFLGRFVGVESGDHPYWLVALSGVTPFTFFSQAVTGSANSLVDNSALVSKVYFPRLLLPVAGAGSSLLDAFLASLVLLVAATVHGGVRPVVLLVLLVPLLVLFTALSLGIWLAALNVRYRDVKVVTPFLLQVWLFVTPVAYPLDLVPDSARAFVALNPMVGVIELERWLVLGSGNVSLIVPSLLASVVLLALGAAYFVRSAVWFSDVI